MTEKLINGFRKEDFKKAMESPYYGCDNQACTKPRVPIEEVPPEVRGTVLNNYHAGPAWAISLPDYVSNPDIKSHVWPPVPTREGYRPYIPPKMWDPNKLRLQTFNMEPKTGQEVEQTENHSPTSVIAAEPMPSSDE